jgi:hypothetical protein
MGGAGEAPDGGEAIVAANMRAVQKRRDGERHLFGKGLKKRFLEQLASSCNVTASARAVGIHPATAYVHRMKDREFAANWWLAMEQGAAKLVALRLQREVERAEALAVEGAMPPDERTMIDLITLMAVLRDLSRGLSGGPKSGRPVGVASIEDTCKALAKRLRAFGVRDGVEPVLKVVNSRKRG